MKSSWPSQSSEQRRRAFSTEPSRAVRPGNAIPPSWPAWVLAVPLSDGHRAALRGGLGRSLEKAGQAPELPRHIRLLLPLLRSRSGGVRSRAIARVPEPVIRTYSTSVFIWRRGWDSNPRYGFPYTAFPVLPVKPLLHLSRESWVRLTGVRLDNKTPHSVPSPDSPLAERVGFEPTVPLRVQRFSRPPDSTTLAPLRIYADSRLLRKNDCNIDLHSLSRTPSSTDTR